MSRQYSAFITRYNIYFNGDEHYKETLKDMESKYEDDYTRILLMHPAEAKADEKAPQPTGDFNRSIEKALKAIQLRSIKKRPKRKAGKGNDPKYRAWLKRDEYNPFLHNAWMMMGRSQYLNGDFLGAASTFYYVAKHFSWLPATVTEAKLWEARSYIAAGWLFEGESLVTKIPEKELTNNTLKGLYYFTYADFLVKSRNYEKAIPMLTQAIHYAKGAQHTRLTFLLGQLYEATGNKTEAYKAFKKAASSGASYRTKFNARIKQSEVFQGNDITGEVKALRTMLRYDRNKDYQDQIYYAIGNLYLSRADTTAAIENYKLAVEKSTRNGIEKAMAQITLGGLYYDLHKYDLAQPCYSEAVPSLPDDYPDIRVLRQRSDVLDELSVYSHNVTLQDSLLKLSYMTPEQQLDVVNKIIEELKKKEKEEEEAAKREEYLAQQAAQGTGLQQNNASTPNTFMLNNDNFWYFYNQATKNAGKTEFQKRWGSRKLEDDWRRRNKASFSFSDFDGENEDGEENPEGEEGQTEENSETTEKDKETLAHESDPHYPEYYLKQIPSTDVERTQANDIIQEGLYNMGLILKDNMHDYTAAESEFNRLLNRYPDNVYRLDTYYNMYLMYMLSGREAEAEKYRQLILEHFPDSKYGEAMRDPEYMTKLREMVHMQQILYDKIYQAYMENNNALVHSIYEQVRRDYPMSRIMPKFMFIEALSYVSDRNVEKFTGTLRELLERYPETDVTPLASAYLKHAAQGAQLQSTGSNMRGMIWATRLSNESTGTDGNSLLPPAEFDLSATGPQSLVLLYPANIVDANQLLFDVARHNFNSYMVRDFDLEQMRFNDLGLLVISGFANRSEVDRYRSTLESDASFKLPPNVVPVVISTHDFQLLLDEGRSFEEYLQAVGDDTLEKVHQSILPPDEYPSAEEMYAPWQQDAPESEETPLPEPENNPFPVQDEQPQQELTPAPSSPEKNKPAPEKTTAPATKPAPVPVPQPEYPDGSEGDDPLFD